MKLWPFGLLMVLAAVVPAFGSSARPTLLDDALTVIRFQYPRAEVVGRFYDWRTTSIYRSRAGLHLGYDIALPSGATVPAAWTGTVVAVIPWVGPQYGITVETEGRRVTYGHLTPLVREGQWVARGQAVGRVCIDHVDIKMRNAAGDYIDFGGVDKVAAVVGADPRQALVDADKRLGEARARLEMLQAQISIVGPERARVQSLASRMDDLYQQGALSHDQATSIVQRGKTLEQRSGSLSTSLAEAQAQVAAAAAEHRRAADALASLGVAPAESNVSVVQPPKRTGSSATDAAHWQSLYAQGAISREMLERHLK